MKIIENFSLRLGKAIEYYKKKDITYSNNSISRAIGASDSYISKILSGKHQPSIDKVDNILSELSDISPTWLLFGSGNMLKDDSIFPRSENENPYQKPVSNPVSISKLKKLDTDLRQNQAKEDKIQYQSMSSIADKQEIEYLKVELQKRDVLLEDKEERIKELKDHIKTLNNRITDMEERIEEFKSAKFSTKMPVLEATQP